MHPPGRDASVSGVGVGKTENMRADTGRTERSRLSAL